jgi:quinol monooxygenase YgiN
MLTVIAQHTARSGRGDDIAAMLRDHVRATRAEPGCLTFIVSRSTDDPESFVLFEQFVDEEAFESHRGSPHFERFVEKGFPLLEKRSWSRYVEIEPTVS